MFGTFPFILSGQSVATLCGFVLVLSLCLNKLSWIVNAFPCIRGLNLSLLLLSLSLSFSVLLACLSWMNVDFQFGYLRTDLSDPFIEAVTSCNFWVYFENGCADTVASAIRDSAQYVLIWNAVNLSHSEWAASLGRCKHPNLKWRASLVPAAAVIPAPLAYTIIVAVKRLVVGLNTLTFFIRFVSLSWGQAVWTWTEDWLLSFCFQFECTHSIVSLSLSLSLSLFSLVHSLVAVGTKSTSLSLSLSLSLSSLSLFSTLWTNQSVPNMHQQWMFHHGMLPKLWVSCKAVGLCCLFSCLISDFALCPVPWTVICLLFSSLLFSLSLFSSGSFESLPWTVQGQT